MTKKSTGRFEFGANWNNYLKILDEERILEAENSLKKMLNVETLSGKSFLDIGSGSGLFSLAARRLGAIVYSFDFDIKSVECTNELKNRYFQNDKDWIINQGDILDADYIASLGRFEIVYSWGVLHHTGAMWKALENAAMLVKDKGMLFIAIYNYQVYWTSFYTKMKRAYVYSPKIGKLIIATAFVSFAFIKGLMKDIVLFRSPFARYRNKKKARGMSIWYDWIDWVGGYPFETAKPEEIFRFYRDKGFTIKELTTCGGGLGCNEFLFKKNNPTIN